MAEKISKKTKLFIINLPLAFSIPITLSLIYYVITFPLDFLGYLKIEPINGVWNFESKITILFKIISWYSLFIFGLVQITAFSRIITQTSPLRLKKENEQVNFIDVMNRVISNSLEQGVIFFPLLSYWTISYSNEDNRVQVLAFGALFLIARIFFWLGYVIGWIIQLPTLRAFGFLTNSVINFIFVFKALNLSIANFN